MALADNDATVVSLLDTLALAPRRSGNHDRLPGRNIVTARLDDVAPFITPLSSPRTRPLRAPLSALRASAAVPRALGAATRGVSVAVTLVVIVRPVRHDLRLAVRDADDGAEVERLPGVPPVRRLPVLVVRDVDGDARGRERPDHPRAHHLLPTLRLALRRCELLHVLLEVLHFLFQRFHLLSVVLAGGDVFLLRLDRGPHRSVDLVPDVAPNAGFDVLQLVVPDLGRFGRDRHSR
mmetsp:Transcript_13701/g.33241  ORF Transcript_13701/g.33241 Transcript_13701/m.33241 type:complete len:236 (+) Transcript_13701:127-834(+)